MDVEKRGTKRPFIDDSNRANPWGFVNHYRRIQAMPFPKRQMTRLYKTARGLYKKWSRRKPRPSGRRRSRRTARKSTGVRSSRKKKRQSFVRKVLVATTPRQSVTGNGAVYLITGENTQSGNFFEMLCWHPAFAGSTPGTDLHGLYQIVLGGVASNSSMFVQYQKMRFKIANMSNVTCNLQAFLLTWKESHVQGEASNNPMTLWDLSNQDTGVGAGTQTLPFQKLPSTRNTRWGHNVSVKKLKTWALDPGQQVGLSHTITVNRIINGSQLQHGAGGNFALVRGLSKTILFILNGQPCANSLAAASNPCYSQAKVGMVYAVETVFRRPLDNHLIQKVYPGTAGYLLNTPGITNERIVVDESGLVTASAII